ncbi:MAG: sigma 54-interacting transcriptional regulator [Pyrinomonadaceae bacterium]
MKSKWVSNRNGQSKTASAKKPKTGKTEPRKTKLDENRFIERLVEIREEISEGLGASAEETILHVQESHELDAEQSAQLDILHSQAFAIRGRDKEALSVLKPYDTEKKRSGLDPKTQVLIQSQLAFALAKNDDSANSLELIRSAIETAKENNYDDIFGELYLISSIANTNLGEYEDALSDADTALDYFRDIADWRKMAWAYYRIGAVSLLKGMAKRSLDYFNLGIQMVGDNSAPVVLGRIFADSASAYWALNQPKEGIEALDRAIEYFTQTHNRLLQIFAYNDLGVSLTVMGDWNRAESAIEKSIELAAELDHPHLAGIYESLGELRFLKGETEEAAKTLKKGIDLAREQGNNWYLVQNLITCSRNLLTEDVEEKTKEAVESCREALNICKKLEESAFDNLLRLVFAEAYFQQEENAMCERELKLIEENDPQADFYVLGTLQRLRGMLALRKEDSKTALTHFRKSLTIFESREDVYHKALLHSLIGDSLAKTDVKKAADHFVAASEIFRKLGVKKAYRLAEKKIDGLEKPKRGSAAAKAAGENGSANSQLLMQRLAEATASRELIFRELVAILQQESKAGRMIVAESDGNGGFQPFLTHGYTAVESNQIVKEMHAAIVSGDVQRFAKTKNTAVFELRPQNAAPAVLLVFPKYSACLHNGEKFNPLLQIVELGMDVCALRENDGDDRVNESQDPLKSQGILPGFIHSSPAMTSLVEEVYKIRSSDVTVLVTGESGTGKELVSRAIHSVSTRSDKVFVPFNCTAVPKELTEGHLFGYRRGAFTGAQNDSPGMIKTADGGTLLLDEIGDLPIDVQPKLLRFLQEGEIQPLGARQPIKVDVRVIAATNMDLEQKVKDGLFREDLFYRINVIRLRVPPLRERRSEIKPIVMYYINHYSQRFNKTGITIKPQTIDLLMVSDWEGNVRQLCNEIQRIVARAKDGEVITPDHISPELKKKPVQTTFDESGNVTPIMSHTGSPGTFTVGMEGTTIEDAVSELETQMILDSLRRNDGNITRVAKELGLTRRGLYMKIDRYGIKRAS